MLYILQVFTARKSIISKNIRSVEKVCEISSPNMYKKSSTGKMLQN